MPNRLSSSISWEELQQHQEEISHVTLQTLFSSTSNRAEQFSVEAAGLHLDYSKNLINGDTLKLFSKLAAERGFDTAREALQAGEKVNLTENRPALHTALRDSITDFLLIDDKDIIAEINQAKMKMADFVRMLHQGRAPGGTGKPITDVVNIGIGGSYLGPKLVIEALAPYHQHKVNCHFVANIDGSEIRDNLEKLNPETTLFIVASKSFGTQETLHNAIAAREWICQNSQLQNAIDKHFVAVSSNIPAAIEFGIAEKNIFPMWDWVGGRYSLWSTIGLPIAISLGMENFQTLLDGAHAMDAHFFTAPCTENMPFIMGMLQIWYNDLFSAHSQAVVPYDYYLRSLPEYLQQLEMESSGKCVDRCGAPLEWKSGYAIWGGPGTNGQHAYHQLFHQGMQFIPVDFIFPLTTHNPVNDHHAMLISNCLAQSRAMLVGKTLEQAWAELERQGLQQEKIEELAPHKVIPGNRPSNTITMEKLTPATLGALIALYEHKVFSQSVIWDINAFDQWGVELGKKIGGEIHQVLSDSQAIAQYDDSTNRLIQRFKAANKR